MFGFQSLVLNRRHSLLRQGFTLVELAIVLAVAALLFAGLWRLIAGSSQQLRDQTAADMQRQIIEGVKAYMATSEGISGLIIPAGQPNAGQPIPTGSIVALALPATAQGVCNNPATINFGDHFCESLPPSIRSNSQNPYGQTHVIGIRKEDPATSTNFSFIVMSINGQVITDDSGGRIASMIGSDGGFIYNVATCGATPANACGSYGGWTAPVINYFAGGGAIGHVASLSYVGSVVGNQPPWLARQLVAATNNGAVVAPSNQLDFFTMQRDMFFNGAGPLAPVPGGGATPNLHMMGRHIAMEMGTLFSHGGVIDGDHPTAAGTGSDGTIQNFRSVTLNNTNGVAGSLALTVTGVGGNACVLNPQLAIPNCTPALRVNGSQTLSGSLSALQVWAVTLFQYNAPSDINIKHDIKPLVDIMPKLAQLKPVSYVLNGNKDEERQLGLIAQDLEKVYPELVKGGPDGYKAVNYIGLIGPLVGAVNELKARNDALAETIAEQGRALDKLKHQIDDKK